MAHAIPSRAKRIMFRVFCFDVNRYYWTGAHWTTWAWAAKPLDGPQARAAAELLDAKYEPFSGSNPRNL